MPVLSFLVGLVVVSLPIALLHLWVRLWWLIMEKRWTFNDGADAFMFHVMILALTALAAAGCWGIYFLGQHLLRGPLGL